MKACFPVPGSRRLAGESKGIGKFFGHCNVILTGSFVALRKDYIKGTKQFLTLANLL